MSQLLNPKHPDPESEGLRKAIDERYVGQTAAVDCFLKAYTSYKAGLCEPGKPISVQLYLGPTGCGKTKAVETFAEVLVHKPRAVLNVDCGEFQHSHDIAKLIGSPPGYLGHRETHPMLSQKALNQHHTETCNISFVLFDEVEKASDALWSLLLGILDKGRLTLGDNTKVDFSNAMIFMTSNLGAGDIQKALGKRLGFVQDTVDISKGVSSVVASQIKSISNSAAKKKFTPEFMNRIEDVVSFYPLSEEEMRSILTIELIQLGHTLYKNQNGRLFYTTEAARQKLLQEGFSPIYGARALKRTIKRLVASPMASLIASSQVEEGDVVRIDYRPGDEELTFIKDMSGLSEDRLTAVWNMVKDPRVTARKVRKAAKAA